MTRVITLPTGRQVTLGEYVRSWKRLLTLPPNKPVANWNWFPSTAEQILRAISEGVQNRINIRAGLKVPVTCPWPQGRIRSRLIRLHAHGLLQCDCRWCGRPLSRYESHPQRFCNHLCRNAYNL